MAINSFPQDSTMLFTQVFSKASDFLAAWRSSGLFEEGLVTDENVTKLYYLLYAKHANDPICAMDVEHWKYMVWDVIYQHGPTWQKELEVQKILRGLSEEELKEGSKTINNIGRNPSTAPSTNNNEELKTINEQSVYKNRNSKVGGYARLLDLLDSDVTSRFLSKFDDLFSLFVRTRPAFFVTD